ncbi:MAG: molybdenum cofactor biosynthesis protein B [Thermofilum sp.]
MMSYPHEKHKEKSPSEIRFAFVTVSTSRYEAKRAGKVVEDESFAVAASLLSQKGFPVVAYRLIPDDSRLILRTLAELVYREDIDVIIFSGGTGPAPSDITVLTLRSAFEKELEGFGDVFRLLSFFDVTSSAFLSSATAGILKGKVIFCVPGSPKAVEKALQSLIIPEAGHLLSLARSR